MHNDLYKKAYTLALGLKKQAAAGSLKDILTDAWDVARGGGKLYLAYKVLLPLLAAAGLGAGTGYLMNRVSRRSDPTVADSGSKEDINRVERLRRIQYYNALSKQLDAVNDNKIKG